MPIFVYRLSTYLRARLTGWRLPLALAVFVFLTSWAAMALVEPADNPITHPANYWWYFIVTAATVGYGDFFPTSPAGHVVGGYVIVGGIVTLTLLFTQLANRIQSIRGRRMRGTVELDLADHVVVLGYTPGRSQRILSEITAEDEVQVALCAWDDQVAENPVPGEPAVHFVRGDLANADVMSRARVDRARSVLIDGRDDNETLAIAVAVHHANDKVHIVAALRDLGRRDHLRYVSPDVQCVQWHMPFLLTEEVTDPGITQVYNDLMSTGGHGNTYSVTLPAGTPDSTFGDWQTRFGRSFASTLLAVRQNGELLVSPPWDQQVRERATLYYVAGERIEDSRLTE